MGGRAGTFVPVELSGTMTQAPRHGGLQIERPGGAVVRLDRDATDEQQRRLNKNVVETLSEVAS